MHDLNADIANYVPAWRLNRDQEQSALDAKIARGPRRVALTGAEDRLAIMANVAQEFEDELRPHQNAVAIYDKALELAGQGLVGHMGTGSAEAQEFNRQALTALARRRRDPPSEVRTRRRTQYARDGVP